MGQANVDCTRIKQLTAMIGKTQQDILKTLKEMRDLGFGTAQTIQTMKAALKMAQVLDKLPPVVWTTLYKFVRCNDGALADLAIEELKLLVEVLEAQAELQINDIKDPQLHADMELWFKELKKLLRDFASFATKDDVIAAIKALKQFLKTIVRKGTPWILDFLIEVYGDEILEAADKLIDKQIKKALIKKIVEKIVAQAVGKTLAKKFVPYVGIAMTGWELLVEYAGGQQIADLQTYVDNLLVQLVKLMVDCGFPWPAKAGNVLRFDGAIWLDHTVTLRPFVRCAKIVDGKVVWGAPCRVKYTGANGKPVGEVTVTLTADKQDNKGNFPIAGLGIDMASVNASTCVAGAKYCYFYDEASFVDNEGKRRTIAFISGAKVFP
jgi:hypothetical protein